MLLYTPNSPTEGHWVCLFRNKDGIHYFDSYGDKPDTEDDLNGQEPLLTQLLSESQLPVFYNTKRYQKLRTDIATCGRHCIARLIYKNKSPDAYNHIVNQFKGEPDDFVSALIYSFIGK
jgi:hypothetical protein